MKPKTKLKVQYQLETDGRFVINQYNQAHAFSNFFPGVAGEWGIPMWVFYVNRGQGISSFGIESKDKSILEFQPANKAWRLTSLQGFRTFLKIKSGSKKINYEPFGTSLTGAEQTMTITSHDLTIEDFNPSLGLKVRVNYFTLPEEPYAGLIRRVTVQNLSAKAYSIEMIDGLPAIIPYGMNDWLVKNMTRTVEAWVKVSNIKNRAPYYNLKVVVNDRPQVVHIKEGNFYFAFESNRREKTLLLEPIVEAACVFGPNNDFLIPSKFFENRAFTVPAKQETANRTPCAMHLARFSLAGKSQKEFVSLTGYATEESSLNSIIKQVTSPNLLDQKSKRNHEIIEGIKNFAFTHSDSVTLNQYCTQNFLDNVLRGGLPVSFQTSEGTMAFNVFNRKHGDPERDYNFFMLAPTYFSQGNGNYRDVNQNRRNDGWFNHDVKDQTIISLMNLIQADGYNPLVVKGVTFSVEDTKKIEPVLVECVKEETYETVRHLCLTGFQPGELLNKVIQKEIRLKVPVDKFLTRLLGVCHKNEKADHGEGFWTDHWTYNLDLIESFLGVYPEALRSLFLEKKVFSFYFDSYYILPRDHRYILTPEGVRQFHSVFHAKDIKAQAKGHKLRVKHGEGAVYSTTLLTKLICLLANKIATLDPSGVGVEMEADKPNWYDALNGLPGLLGSSVSETIEVKRFAAFTLDALNQLKVNDQDRIKIFEELASFVSGLSHILATEPDSLHYWNKANDLKEHYRHCVRTGVSGEESDMTFSELKRFLQLTIERTDSAIKRSCNEKNIYTTYFTHEVVEHELIDKSKQTQLHSGASGHETGTHATDGVDKNIYVRPLTFKRHDLPLFLEGFVHALRVAPDRESALKIYQAVKKGSLYDPILKMYRVNADLSKESESIGRTRIFPVGWLENGSIWLHMEYKFLLELLRRGLYEEFYQEIPHTLIPFLKPETYGRSILENSSFLVSSVHEDKRLHGRGFVARLSGSTAEFIHMWLLMNLGRQVFRLNEKSELTAGFEPVLPGWLFTKKQAAVRHYQKNYGWSEITLPKDSYAFNFMGSTLIVYHNPRRLDTFGKNKTVIEKINVTYHDKKNPVTINTNIMPSPIAQDLRENRVARVDVYLR